MWTRLKPDHDVIMTLSEVREKLPFKLISVYVRGHQDDKRDYDDLTRPEQLNVLADHRASTALQDLCVAGQPTRFYPLPACRGYLRDTSGDILNREQRTLRTEFLGASFERTYRNATIGQIRSMIPSAGLYTDQPLLYSPTVSGPSWSNSVVARYPSAYARDDAVLRLVLSTRSALKPKPYPTCNVHLEDTHTVDTLRCSIVDGIQSWFTTGATNDPDNTDPVVQIGCFQVIKGCIPNE
jgi:hypothetical protein